MTSQRHNEGTGTARIRRATDPLYEWPNTEPGSALVGTSDYLDLEDEAVIALGLKHSAGSADPKPRIYVLQGEGNNFSR
jgi:hypothetical protein